MRYHLGKTKDRKGSFGKVGREKRNKQATIILIYG